MAIIIQNVFKEYRQSKLWMENRSTGKRNGKKRIIQLNERNEFHGTFTYSIYAVKVCIFVFTFDSLLK